MKKITRTATEQDLADLVARPEKAHVTVVRDGRPEAVPVSAARAGDAWRVRAHEPVPAGPAMLLIDEGLYYFDLRGLRYPGQIGPADPDGAQTFTPEKTIGWHYGLMRPIEAP